MGRERGCAGTQFNSAVSHQSAQLSDWRGETQAAKETGPWFVQGHQQWFETILFADSSFMSLGCQPSARVRFMAGSGARARGTAPFLGTQRSIPGPSMTDWALQPLSSPTEPPSAFVQPHWTSCCLCPALLNLLQLFPVAVKGAPAEGGAASGKRLLVAAQRRSELGLLAVKWWSETVYWAGCRFNLLVSFKQFIYCNVVKAIGWVFPCRWYPRRETCSWRENLEIALVCPESENVFVFKNKQPK